MSRDITVTNSASWRAEALVRRYRSRGLTLGTKGTPTVRTGACSAIEAGSLVARGATSIIETTPATTAASSVTVASRTMLRFSSGSRMARKPQVSPVVPQRANALWRKFPRTGWNPVDKENPARGGVFTLAARGFRGWLPPTLAINYRLS